MSTNISDLRDTIVPKSDQLNAEQLLGGPMTITVTDVRRGGGEEQPVTIHYEGEGGRPYKPCKSMRKILVFAWGSDGRDWAGRSMTLYNRPDVKFGGEEVGGIRISHLSDIPKDIAVALTATRGRKEQTRIKRLVIAEVESVEASRRRLEVAARTGMESLKSAWANVPKANQRSIGGCPEELKTVAQKADAGEQSTTDARIFTFDESIQKIRDAADRDALDDAYSLVDLYQPAERQILTEAYNQRADELDLP